MTQASRSSHRKVVVRKEATTKDAIRVTHDMTQHIALESLKNTISILESLSLWLKTLCLPLFDFYLATT